MPVAWEEFEAVETPKRTSVNWNDFEPVPAPTEPPEPFGPPNPDIAVIPSEPATTPEEQTFRRMTGERALGTALTPPKVGGLFDPVLEAPRLPAPAQVKIQPFEQAIAMAFPGTQLPSAVLGSERAAAINRSAVNIVPETFNFLSSPGGLATLGLGAYGGPVAKTLMSLGFSGDMAWNLVKQVKQLYTDWDKMDGAQRASAITDAAKTALFAGGAGVHGVKSGRELLLDRQQPPPLPQPAPPVIPKERVLVPPPLPERPGVPPPLPEVEKPRTTPVDDYVEPEPTDVVVRQSEFTPAVKVPEQKASLSPEEIANDYSKNQVEIENAGGRRSWLKQKASELGESLESFYSSVKGKLDSAKSAFKRGLESGDILEVTGDDLMVQGDGTVKRVTKTEKWIVSVDPHSGRMMAVSEKKPSVGLEVDSGMHFFNELNPPTQAGVILPRTLKVVKRNQPKITPAVPVPEKPTGPAAVPATPAQATVAPAGEISKDAQTLLNDPKFIADAKAMETRDHPELAAKHPDAMDQIPVDEIKDDPAGYKKAVEQFKEEQPKEQPAPKPKEPSELSATQREKNITATEWANLPVEEAMLYEKRGIFYVLKQEPAAVAVEKKGAPNAIQEPSAASVHVRETPADSEAVAQGVRPAEEPAKATQQTPPAKTRDVVLKQGAVGQMLGSGEVILTSSGRKTTPFPKVSTDTNRKTSATLKRVDAWLRDNAIAEAEARGDKFNASIFKSETGKIPQASKDAMEEYLFGEQPNVPKSILKPISSPSPIPAAQAQVSKPQPTAPEPGPVGMGGAVPSEFGRVGGSPAATKFRMMDENRVARGLEPLLKPESKKDQAVLDEAMGRYDNDPAGADVLAKELIDKPRPITDVENDYMLLRWIDTRDQYHRSAREAQLADRDGRTADLAAINGQTARWSAAMTTLEQALRFGGSETGRALRARRILIAEDFTLAGMETRLRTELQSQGMPESEIVKQLEAKRGELQKLADQYKAAAEAAKDLLSDETQARKRAEQALADIQKEVAGQPRFDKRVLDYAEKFVSGMEKIADGYMKELQGAVWSPTPDMLAKAAFIGATKIARGVKDLATWTDEMAANLGDKFRPYAKQVWEMSQKALDKQLSKVPEGVKKAVKMVTPQDRRAASLKQVKTRLEKQQKDISGLVQKIARTHVEEGIREREALIDAVHADLRAIAPDMTRRDVMDAISGYGDYRQISKEEISVVLRDLKGQMQQVGKLQDMAGGRAPSKTGFERRTPSDEERQLIQQVEEAKKRGGYTVTNPEAQLKTAMDALHTRLRNQITDLETQISNREKIVKKRTRLQYDEEANRLKARRDELKKVFDEVFPKEPMTEAERLDRWNRHLEKRIGEFERRIKERDFSKRERAKPPVPDERALANMDRMEQVQEQFHELLLREKYRNMKLHEKAWVATKEALNIPRNVMTSADVSAVLRQGGILAGSHPEIAAKALTPMFRGMASERLAGIVDQEILQRPNAKSGRYAQAKLYLAPLRSTTLSAMEEQIMSRFAHHIPVVRASNRAFITFLNRLRADAFDKLTEKLEENGKPLTDAELKAIGNYINIATGRGEMGRFAAASEALATTFFSPRLVVSRFQYMMGQPLWRGSARTRKLIVMEYARSLTALGVILGLATVAGATVDTDPRSSDFGKMRFGNTRLDPMAGLSQTAVLMTRLFTGQKKTSKGEIVPIRGTLRFGLENTADVVWRFLRSKFSPVVGTALNIASGENVVGEPVTAGQELGKMLIPLSFQDVFNVMREQGVAGGTAMLALSLLGMGMQYYEPKPSSQNKRPSRPSRSERPNR